MGTTPEVVSRMGEAAAHLGFGRITAQIYGLLMISDAPLSLDEMAQALGVSKASVSVYIRALASLGAVRKVWAPESRRDLYELEEDLLKVLRIWCRTGLQRRLEEVGSILDQAERNLARAGIPAGEPPRARKRLDSVRALHRKLTELAELLPHWLEQAVTSK
jgi:DNA-binding transcriptional regulator GbsR (MarR family)